MAISGPTVSATFAYDALGRRTTKTINGQSISVLYDGLDTVKESGPDGDASHLRTLGIDEALSRTDANGTLTYLPDALGSTLALADSSGATSTTYTYAPFGETSVSGLPSSSPVQFTGRENDGTGLYYYRARYYDPGRSRFVSEDPIGLAGGDANLYAYAKNTPVNHTDPSGLDTYRCKRPLHGLDDVGQKSGPESQHNPLYHEFICVKVGGKTICGGQTMAPGRYTGHAIPWGPGSPSEDYYDPRHCEKTSDPPRPKGGASSAVAQKSSG
jgi:RHS repeat-associated protein